MSARSTSKFSAPLAAHLSARFVRNSIVRHGTMFGFPAFFVGRRMFACVYGDGVGIKLPETRVRRMLESTQAKPFRPYGKPAMREWIAISSRLAITRRGSAILREAIAFAKQEAR